MLQQWNSYAFANAIESEEPGGCKEDQFDILMKELDEEEESEVDSAYQSFS
jgi:hypothetical protein